MLPGRIRIAYPSGFSYEPTHSENRRRITRPPAENAASRPGLWIFGCSFTYGESLEDDKTYAWLLQKKMPQYDVENFGVVGYGTLQSLIRFRRELAAGKKPEIVVLAYASFHDERNASLRSWRKWNRLGTMPYARFDAKGDLQYFNAELAFTEFPLMRHSALIHFLEKAYDRQEGNWLRAHGVSEALVKEFSDACSANGVKFVVAGISSDRLTGEMLEYCTQNGIAATNISVDLNTPGFNNLPHDAHPGARANEIYAERLHAGLSQ